MIDAGVKSLLLLGGEQEKTRTDMAMVSKVIVIPRKTLPDYYARAKLKLDAECNNDLDVYAFSMIFQNSVAATLCQRKTLLFLLIQPH